MIRCGGYNWGKLVEESDLDPGGEDAQVQGLSDESARRRLSFETGRHNRVDGVSIG